MLSRNLAEYLKQQRDIRDNGKRGGSRRPPSKLRCYECNGIGHVRLECPNLQRHDKKRNNKIREVLQKGVSRRDVVREVLQKVSVVLGVMTVGVDVTCVRCIVVTKLCIGVDGEFSSRRDCLEEFMP
ncbi:hypothetical protein F2Q68_00016434 [Brassica cretica]|uniref:CCHC-type domain-containing protein n=1 Tax=Brassica cretica TaxID=69181 RepID=A0A8S9HMQ5_BRACR|nr:hypothetical protein F2Q68_00016434 [Brassica cretica]